MISFPSISMAESELPVGALLEYLSDQVLPLSIDLNVAKILVVNTT